MPKLYEIQYADPSPDDFNIGNDEFWETRDSDTDAVMLLKRFVGDVNAEEIDDVNLYWRVKETDA